MHIMKIFNSAPGFFPPPVPRRQRLRSFFRGIGGVALLALLFVPWSQDFSQTCYVPLVIVTLLSGCADMWLDFRRRRPRVRVLSAAVLCGSLGVVWAVIMPLFLYATDSLEAGDISVFMIMGAAALAVGAGCLFWWRRLSSAAVLRLQRLRAERARRDRILKIENL